MSKSDIETLVHAIKTHWPNAPGEKARRYIGQFFNRQRGRDMNGVRPWRLQEITYKHVRERRYEVAVLPIGSTEPHGLHLPYGSDAFHSGMMADRVCERAYGLGAKVILLPTIPYGVNSNLMGFPLTMHVRQSTLNTMIRDIVRSVERQGIRKFLLLNGHGGNEFKPLLRDLYGETGVFIALVDWWKVAADMQEQVFEAIGDHADEMETSVDLALFGDLVHMEDADDGAVRATRFEAINRGWVSITRPWHLLTRDSGHGDPRKASREKGEQYLSVVVERLAPFIVELSNAVMDAPFPYSRTE